MRPIDLPPAEKYPHGTRSRFVCGCRCEPCREANRAVAHARVKAIEAARADVTPNPPIAPRTMQRGGKDYRFEACPGVNGTPCVRGGTWLKNRTPVCVHCVEHATVWNGLVDAGPARKHLLALSAKGVGYKAVAAACDVGRTTLTEVIAGRKPMIQAHTAKRILAVDEGARADHSLVPSAPSMRLLAGLQRRGFSQRWIAKALGYKGLATQFVHDSGQITAANARAIEVLARKVKAEKIEPPPFKGWVPAAPTIALLRWMLDEGFTKQMLTQRLGVTIQAQTFARRFVREGTEKAVAHLHRELNAEGDALPTDGVEHERLDLADALKAGERSAAELASDFCVTSRTIQRQRAAARSA